MISRREFIKNGFCFLGAVSVTAAGLNTLLPEPTPFSTGNIHGSDFIRLFKAECELYPKGHLIRLLRSIEVLKLEKMFSVAIRGLSVSQNGRNAKYFMFIVDETLFIENYNYRRNFFNNIEFHLVKAWKESSHKFYS